MSGTGIQPLYCGSSWWEASLHSGGAVKKPPARSTNPATGETLRIFELVSAGELENKLARRCRMPKARRFLARYTALKVPIRSASAPSGVPSGHGKCLYLRAVLPASPERRHSCASCGTNRLGRQVSHPHQIIGGGREGEHPPHHRSEEHTSELQ